MTYSNYVLPACIPNDTSSYANKIATATGWGTTSSGGSTSRYLMQVSMPWLTDSVCIQKYPQIFNIDNSVCAGETGGNKDTCQVIKNFFNFFRKDFTKLNKKGRQWRAIGRKD